MWHNTKHQPSRRRYLSASILIGFYVPEGRQKQVPTNQKIQRTVERAGPSPQEHVPIIQKFQKIAETPQVVQIQKTVVKTQGQIAETFSRKSRSRGTTSCSETEQIARDPEDREDSTVPMHGQDHQCPSFDATPNTNHPELTATIGGPSDTVSRSSGRCDSRVATTVLTIHTVQKTGEVQRLERSCGRARDGGSRRSLRYGTQRPFPQRSPRRPDKTQRRQRPRVVRAQRGQTDPTRSEAKGLGRTPKVGGCLPDSPRGESGR